MGASLDLMSLSRDFATAFDSKNVNALVELFSDDCYVQDPNSKINGKDALYKIHKELFDKTNKVAYEILKVFVHPDYQHTTCIKFKITLDDKVITGLNVITWDENGKICKLIFNCGARVLHETNMQSRYIFVTNS